jgi:hypothetical protein
VGNIGAGNEAGFAAEAMPTTMSANAGAAGNHSMRLPCQVAREPPTRMTSHVPASDR